MRWSVGCVVLNSFRLLLGALFCFLSFSVSAMVAPTDYPELRRSYVVSVDGYTFVLPSPDCFSVGRAWVEFYEAIVPGTKVFATACSVGAPGVLSLHLYNASTGASIGPQDRDWYLAAYTDSVAARVTFWDQVNALSLSDSGLILTAIGLCWVVGWAVRQSLRVGTPAND